MTFKVSSSAPEEPLLCRKMLTAGREARKGRVPMCLMSLGRSRSNSHGVMADREAGRGASEPGRQSAQGQLDRR